MNYSSVYVLLEDNQEKELNVVILIILPCITRIMRTPTEDIWPGVSEMPDYKASFPKWNECVLGDQVPRLKPDVGGMDLLMKMLIYSPAKRMSAKAAIEHSFFDDLDKASLPQYQGQTFTTEFK